MNLIDYYQSRTPRSYEVEWPHRWALTLVQRALEERKNLIIEMHPRSGKSEIVNQYAPAWWLESHPDATFGLVTSEDGLAAKFVSGTRRLLAPAFKFEVERQGEFKIAGTRGLDLTYTGRGIHSAMQGRGFDCLILDDCLKSGTDAMSENIRERLWVDVVSAALNRLSPAGICVALQSRLHQQDPIGRLLDTGMKFLRLHLPATNDNGENAWVEDTYTGENKTLIPAYRYLTRRYPRAKLDEIRATVNEYFWSAQYQMAPNMGDLAFFKCDPLPSRYDYPDVVRCWLAWDAAMTATKGGSYSAGVALGLLPDSRIALLDVRRGRWNFTELEQQVFDHFHAVARMTGIAPEAVVVERAASGFGLIDRLDGILPIVPLIPKGSKEDRAASVCSLWNRNLVLLPQQAPWLSMFLDELGAFPLSAHADQVDSFVHALSYVARPGEFKPKAETRLLVTDLAGEPVTEEEFHDQAEYIRNSALNDWAAQEELDDLFNGKSDW